MGAMASLITSFAIVYSTVYSGPDQRKHQSSASLPFVLGIHRWPVTGELPAQMASNVEMFPFDDVIMLYLDIYGMVISLKMSNAVLLIV